MSEPKNHHYIPQSYLRNFSEERKGEYYVFVRYLGEKFHETNIRNICSENYFYSIPNAPPGQKNIIEKYYAEEIDTLFPAITEVITNDSISKIDFEQRKKIVSAALSLYFRTPKFLKIHNTHLKRIIELTKQYTLGNSEIHTIDFLGRKIDFANVDFEKLEDDVIKQNKIVFLKQHFEIFNALVDYKLHDGIGIKKIIDDSEFITSDNPVIIRNPKEGLFLNLFDPSNFIHLTINHKYLLTILPKDSSIVDSFNRIEGHIRSALVINHDVENNSEKWIIGSKKSVNSHLDDQFKYNDPTPENEKMVTDIEEEVKLFKELEDILTKNNNTITDEFVKQLKVISEHPLLKNDSNVIKTVRELRAKGYKI